MDGRGPAPRGGRLDSLSAALVVRSFPADAKGSEDDPLVFQVTQHLGSSDCEKAGRI